MNIKYAIVCLWDDDDTVFKIIDCFYNRWMILKKYMVSIFTNGKKFLFFFFYNFIFIKCTKVIFFTKKKAKIRDGVT